MDKEEKQNMAEGFSFLNKGTIVKSTKKSPLPALRMVVLAIVMICCVYICSFCLRQANIRPNPKIMKTELMENQCHHHRSARQAEIDYVHYPEPVTYSRNECARTPVRFFAILSMQRSGSGWFETLLNSHVNISSNGEIFSVKQRRSNISAITRTLDKV